MRVKKSYTFDKDIVRWIEKEAIKRRVSVSDVLNQELGKAKEAAK